jgi:hypothetical protein
MLAQCLRALCQQDAAAALHLTTVLQSKGMKLPGLPCLLEGCAFDRPENRARPEELIPCLRLILRLCARWLSWPASRNYGQFHILSASRADPASCPVMRFWGLR